MAPVPYSIRTYGAAKHGTRSPFTGLMACTPSAKPSFVSASSRLASEFARAFSISGSSFPERPTQLGQPAHRGVLHGEDEERHAPQRVGPGREDRDLLARLLDREDHACALAAPDPVPLHRDDPLGPVDQLVHVVEQALRVVGDLEEPLRQVAPLDHRPATLARAGDHLLVGQHGLVVGTPVHRRVLAVGQPALEEPREEPLGPPVVLGIARLQASRPVERHAHPLERRRLLLDVDVRPVLRRDPALDGRVLGRQAEGVPADGMQDVVPRHRLVARDRVAAAEGLGVAHVQIAGRVREHVERVEPRPAVLRVLGGQVQALLLPDPLPLRLDLGRVVSSAHRG